MDIARFDNGHEFTNAEFRKLLIELGIAVEYTPVDGAKRNDHVEKKLALIAEGAKTAWLEFPRHSKDLEFTKKGIEWTVIWPKAFTWMNDYINTTHFPDLEFPNKALEWTAIWPEAFTWMDDCINTTAQAHVPDKLCPSEKLYKRRATSLPLPFMMPGFRHRNRKNETDSKDERCFYRNTGNDHSSTTHEILLSSRVCSFSADVTLGYRRAPFVEEVPMWGGGAVVDVSAAASAPAAATVISSGVFAAASARKSAGASASAAVAAASVAIRPNGARGTAAARGGISPTPSVGWTIARHDEPPETATTQRRRHQVIPAATRSGSRRTGMSEAFALLEADEKVVRSLATEPEADGDPELPAALACDLETPEMYAKAHAGLTGAFGGRWSTRSSPDLQHLGRLNRRGWLVTAMQPYFVWIFVYFSGSQYLLLFVIYFIDGCGFGIAG